MSFSMSRVVASFRDGLSALSAVLDKAAAFASARKIDETVFLDYRLAPGMFAHARQVQIACDQPKNVAVRMSGVEPPRFQDNETRSCAQHS